MIKKVLCAFLLVLCCLGISSFAAESGGLEYSSQQKEETVYVCTGGSATKYHSRSNCRGLGKCKGKIVSMPISQAKKQGRTACKICY